MAKPFTTMTVAGATLVSARLQQFRAHGVPALCMVGAWRNRRYVIDQIRPAKAHVGDAVLDDEAGSLTIPIDADPSLVLRESRRFGARMEHRSRKDHRGFEVDVSTGDGRAHTLHRHHHVALCGHTGPWPDTPAVALDGVTGCLRCQIASVTKPAFRARYHPTADEDL